MRIFWKVVKILLVVLIIGAACAGGIYYYTESNREPPLHTLYATELSAVADVSQILTATGYVNAKESITLYMTRAETVETVHVKEGDYLSAGDILITYDIAQDETELLRKKAQAEINLANAQLGLQLIGQPAQGNELVQYESDVATAEKNRLDAENDLQSTAIRIVQQQRKIDDAQKTLTRSENLYLGGAMTQYEYELAVSAYQSAVEAMNDLQLQKEIRERTLELRITQQEEAAQRLKNALNKSSEDVNILKYQQQENIIRLNRLELAQIEDDLAKLVAETVSPVTGYVEAVYALAGAVSAKGSPLIRLADLSQLRIKADVSEYIAPMLTPGQSVTVRSAGLPDRVYTGEVTKIAAGAVEKEKSSGTEQVVPVEIILHDADAQLKTGYTVDIAFYVDIRSQVVSVPVQSVANENGRHYVYLLHETGLEKREVITGLYGDKRVEIIEGLLPDEPVVLNQAEIQTKHRADAHTYTE